jgi:hypothetical protein
MLGKGVTVGDCVLALAIDAPVGLALGAFVGYFGVRFGLSGSIRTVAIVPFAGLAGQFARIFVKRRVTARATSLSKQG